MSTSGITGILLSQIVGSSSTANQFAGDLNQLAGDLQSGNMSSAQEDYVTLSEDALKGAGASLTPPTTSGGISAGLLSSIAGSTNSSAFVNELNQIGTDLGNSDLQSAQEDMLSLSSTALNAASLASTGSAGSSNSSTTNSPPGQLVSADLQTDIRAVLEAMSAGDSSAASSAMQQLASAAGNSPGATYLQQLSGASNSSSGTTSSSNSVEELLQSLNSTQPSLSPLA